jgi:putative ABC transport system permease protein
MKLALREIRRAKLRFALLASAVGLLVFLLLFFQSVAGALLSGFTGGLEQTDADVLVYEASARSNPTVSVLPPDAVDVVASVTGVQVAAPVSQTFATVESDGEQQDGVLVGIDPGAPGTPVSVDQGRLPEGPGEALASGSGLAPGFDLGARVSVDGGEDLEVVGIAADAAFNVAATLYLPNASYAAILEDRIGEGVPVPVSYVAVRAADGIDPAELAERITAEIEDVQALTLADAIDTLPGVDQISRSFGILYLLLFIVVTIVTGVFFLILTVQKRDALVLLRAVGAERRDVVLLVLTQVVLVVGAGVVVGAGLAVGLLALANDVFGATVDASTTVTSGLAVLTLGLVAATGALRRVLAIEPVDAAQSTGLS